MAEEKADVAVQNEEQSRLPTEEELNQKAAEVGKAGILGGMFSILPVEAKRLIYLALMITVIAFTYSFMRVYKDRVIYSVLEPSAQNWLKIFTFLASLLFVGIIQKLLAHYNSNIDKVFEVCSVMFIVLFTVLAFALKFRYLIPLDDLWAKRLFICNSATTRNINLLYMPVLMVNHIVLSIFYIVSEVVGSIMVSYLFFSYLNAHCTPDQNKRFVRPLLFVSNLAGFLGGQVYDWWSKHIASKSEYLDDVENYYFVFTLVAAGLFGINVVLKRILDRVFAQPIVATNSTVKKSKGKAKKSVSITDGVYYAVISKFLMAMCGITLFYNISTNLLTSIASNSYSAAAQVMGEDKSSFGTKYKSLDTRITAISVAIIMLTPISRMSKYFGIIGPSAVPVIITFFGILISTILAGINYPSLGNDNMAVMRIVEDLPKSPMLEVYCNLTISALMKISKYAFFDIAKEEISMKINPEIRPLFKGVYDGVCGKFGKCSGAIYGIIMDGITNVRDARYCVPVTFCIITVFCILWSISVVYLHRSFKSATAKGTYMSPDYFQGVTLKDE